MRKGKLLALLSVGALAANLVMPSMAAAADKYIMNADFENGKTVGWTITGDRVVDVASKQGDAQGAGAMHYWSDKDFNFTASQEVTDVPDGVYDVSVMTQGGGGEKSITLFAESGGVKKTAAITNIGWNQWQTFTVQGVEVKGGKVLIGVTVDANAGNWGSFDNFSLTPSK